jgi:ribose transport system permease protein
MAEAFSRPNVRLATMAAAAIFMLALVPAVMSPYFGTAANLQNLSRNAGFFALFAVAQMLPILVRGLDLSQGGLVAVISVVSALAAPQYGVPAAFTLALLLSVAVGCFHGLLIGGFGLSAFVVTLGTGSALSGAALLLSNGQTIYDVPPGYEVLGWSDPLGFPLIAWFSLILTGALTLLLRNTALGRMVYATGSNPEAALVLGIRTKLITGGCYVVSAPLTACGGLFLSSRITSGSPVIGSEIALQSIAAAVLGGVSLFGGRGQAVSVVLGAIALAMLANLLNLYNISSYWQAVMFGLIIVIAASFDRLRSYH